MLITALRFRASTSLLYGDSAERRWQALAAADPLALPWIADALARIRAALAQIGGRDAAGVGRAGVR